MVTDPSFGHTIVFSSKTLAATEVCEVILSDLNIFITGNLHYEEVISTNMQARVTENILQQAPA